MFYGAPEEERESEILVFHLLVRPKLKMGHLMNQ